MPDLILQVPLIGQKDGYDGQPLMQPDASGKMKQHGFMACWYASACMVSLYYRAGPRLGLPIVWKADAGLTVSAIAQLATVEGLTPIQRPAGGLTAANVKQLLTGHGPIWAAGRYLDQDQNAGHAIVVVGVDGSNVIYNDPWEPRQKTKNAAWLDSRLLNLQNALLVKDPSRY